ncbi:fructan beta-fructosidase [Salipaludibacillus aurantiacus]|uniref:Fructan beta-fructosidase n=2 Tax=Salipaludibacillus aurantiacus TaxID=1601833 RepID=A0A1H9TF87_9BACI|nr:glycoside hydrolase family 32 protein [Salipaludibacillus aurantiacus]SER95801.1 fructan beta-fructosidase [Salipaludibacillus aurantiacus]
MEEQLKHESPAQSLYNEPYRPHIHFTPESQWMNDPNGMVYYEGEYHLFYQYHPHGKTWGPMHWGHAVSVDMYQWKHLPIAMEPDSLGMIFSGSAVVDWHDTTGFFNGSHGLVALYTSADGDFQQQSIAFSKDKGRTWHKYEGNPVIPNPGIKDFRDPKVFWHEASKKWIMVLAAGQEIMFYRSSDLKTWEYTSKFGENQGAHGGVWECPDLFQLPVANSDKTKWVLEVDVQAGAAAGGSGGQYFIGQFDGKEFVNEAPKENVLWVDYGKDFYAAQSFSDMPDSRRVWLAWMSNWQYANEVPTHPWRSAMSLPREVSLTEGEDGKIKLLQQPASEIKGLINKEFINSTVQLSHVEKILCLQPDAPFSLTFKMKTDDLSRVAFSFYNSGTTNGCNLVIDKEAGEITFDREKMKMSHFHKDFPAKTSAPFDTEKVYLKIEAIVDRGSVEIFINDGEQTLTNLVLPEGESFSISGASNNGELEVDCKGHSFISIWK